MAFLSEEESHNQGRQPSQILWPLTYLPLRVNSLSILTNIYSIFNDRPVTYRCLMGKAYISKLYFNFNFNNYLIKENAQYYTSKNAANGIALSPSDFVSPSQVDQTQNLLCRLLGVPSQSVSLATALDGHEILYKMQQKLE